jgi:putative ABC transport system substrate-binding protein
LGADALSYALRRDWRAPVLAALIPRSGYERTLKESSAKNSQPSSAMYLDQPFGRQLDLLRLALPDAKKVGVLWGPQSIAQQNLLLPALQQRAMSLVSSSTATEGSLFGALRVVLDDADVLLAVADPQVYSSATISGILLSTYRARTPVLAFSPAYVKAGALLALHTTPAQVGTQVAVMARQLLQGGPLPSPQYPTDYQVSVNEHVARSLGLTLDARSLEDRLRRLEKKP